MDKELFSLKFKLQWFSTANESKLHCIWWMHKMMAQNTIAKNEQTSQKQKSFFLGMKFDILIN